MNAFGKISALGLLISITILVPDSSCSSKGKVQEPGGYQPPEPWDYQVKEPLDDQLQEPLDDQLQEPLDDQLQEPLDDQLQEPLDDQLQEPLDDQLQEPLDDQLQEPLDDQLQVPLDDQLQEPLFSYESSCMNGKQMAQNSSLPLPQVNITVSVQMGTKARLCCPHISLTKALLITWEITTRDQPPCIISFKVETKETNETNCTDRRITWASTPDQSPDLQISAVALDHDGHYLCIIATHNGNFIERHDLQVLVPPAVTLFPGKYRTAVCEATAGKPAAQIFWTPEGYCKTKNESHSNGTVTVRSTCHCQQSNVSAVFCFVSHLTGNQTLSIELNQGVTSMPLHSLLTILYVKLSLLGIILLIIGFVFFQKRNYFRK